MSLGEERTQRWGRDEDHVKMGSEMERLEPQKLEEGKNLPQSLQREICSDFGARKNKVSHGFHCFPIYLP